MVSLCLCTLDRYDLTVQCVGAALAGACYPFELLCVDNGSTDQRVIDYIASFDLAYHRKNATNEGYARMMNQMMLRAKGEYICLIDNDMLLPDGWLRILVEYNEAIPETGWATFHCVMGLFPETVLCGKRVHVHDNVYGVKFFRRDVLEKVGYLCEEYTPYGNEDLDYGYRLRKAGYVNYYVGGGLKAEHLGNDVGQNTPYRNMKWASLANAALVWERRQKIIDAGDFFVPAPVLC